MLLHKALHAVHQGWQFLHKALWRHGWRHGWRHCWRHCGGIVAALAAWLAALAAWLAALAALLAAYNASSGIVWRHGGMAALSGGIGGIVAALLAAWRHCWRHCGGIGGIADLQLPRSPLVSVLPLWAGDEGCTICSRAWCRKDAQGKVWWAIVS